ncbi:type VI secretion system protein TssA [Mesorhizobium sp. CA18]|uniref:type VI secretion system protein TssA n=1 Tax=unclassified Mesorhizobium TaxID=325217 RepID=UPI001CCCA92F|nr:MULTISPECIES: type VI secretion system protein TssA [unclassified Mesorhizobium]MBZ9734263.1 type VI secretion system protein TssA [Mesorhizobium sp. CA9]MBZ9824544.1 type VI secretion system protein TssA [Mesorhizobium sp. CA18]MBZ9829498.1 type VI secretion system protein TssA [Mesorhizobium sp. CA2]MBZ9837197.1 type VI secretion system protein TssA [Mesorhizobium sp. CA3]MBZ9877912.1 type VI secretion system protein TssA [Mesorhizobium sp. Ca11]
MIDLALWLNPLNGENPSGEDLRNDPAFHELERLAEPQLKVVHDGNSKPTSQPSPVDWAAVLEKAEELRARGRDLRLLVIVARALANEEGLAGLAQGLTLIARTFEQYWDTMHPSLRTGAPRDAALRRINALLDLQNGQEGLLANLRQMAFFSPRAIGPISGRDLEQAALDERVMLQEAASGLGAAEKAALTSAHNQLLNRVRTGCAAQIDQAADVMTSLLADARAAIAALDAVDAALNARIDGHGATIPELKKFLQRLLTTLERNSGAGATANGAAKATPQAAAEPAMPARNGHGAETMASVTSAVEASTGLPDRINSRDEVVKCLDLVVAFYDRTEPSSPIPHLARRVRRMVHMDFVELMEDLAPSGLKEFRLLAGVPDPKKPAQKDER